MRKAMLFLTLYLFTVLVFIPSDAEASSGGSDKCCVESTIQWYWTMYGLRYRRVCVRTGDCLEPDGSRRE